MKTYFEIQGDVLIKNTPVPNIGNKIIRREIVIDKETFIKCYEGWIEKERKND